MTHPIYGSHLILTAEKLAGVGASQGRPAFCDLRRATSTAYYALFHQVIRHGAYDFLPSATAKEAADVARWFTHSGVLAAAGLVLSANTNKPLSQFSKHDRVAIMAIRSASGGLPGWRLVIVVDAFQSLQAARVSADYDGNYSPVRAVTINHVQDAKAALKETRLLWNGQQTSGAWGSGTDPGYSTFLRLALLKSGGPRGR